MASEGERWGQTGGECALASLPAASTLARPGTAYTDLTGHVLALLHCFYLLDDTNDDTEVMARAGRERERERRDEQLLCPLRQPTAVITARATEP